jgi:hypothetical protein
MTLLQIIGVFLIIIFIIGIRVLDDFLQDREVENISEKETEIIDEDQNLSTIRAIYVITWFGFCFLYVIFSNHLKNISPKLEQIVMSCLFIYGGIGGLIAKMGLLKLPIRSNSKIYYIINSLLVCSGTFFLLYSLLEWSFLD